MLRYFGVELGNLRKGKFTQLQLGEKLDYSSQHISRWETGQQLPDLSMLPSIIKALQCDENEAERLVRAFFRDYLSHGKINEILEELEIVNGEIRVLKRRRI